MAICRQKLLDALGLAGGEANESELKNLLGMQFSKEMAKKVWTEIIADLEFFKSYDPASASYTAMQILSIRRGMAAIAAHRILHAVLKEKPTATYEAELLAKGIQKDANVEIHPLATIGVPFALDHGHGTVIGATCHIGRDVFIYHGVTLGASGKCTADGRRHPVVGNGVFFGNGSQLLGPVTIGNNTRVAAGVIIRDAKIGANVRISMRTRIAGVVIPDNAHVFAADLTSLQRYWVKLADAKEAAWVEFKKFDCETCGDE